MQEPLLCFSSRPPRGADPVLLPLLFFFPSFFHPTQLCRDLSCPFQCPRSFASVQLMFCENCLICRCILFFLILFIYLFLTVLGLRFCARAFSSCGKQGPLFIAVHGPLTIAASLVAEHRLQTRRLSSCGSRA